GRLFSHRVRENAARLFRVLSENGALAECGFGDADHPAALSTLSSPADLRDWAGGPSLLAAKRVPADSSLLTSEDLVGDIVLTFDRLLPAYICAVEPEPLSRFARWDPEVRSGGRFTDADFSRATFLDADWLS